MGEFQSEGNNAGWNKTSSKSLILLWTLILIQYQLVTLSNQRELPHHEPATCTMKGAAVNH